MTIPFERTRAVDMARSFMEDLIDPQKTPRVPKAIRQQALYVLRHYPTQFDMETISRREEMSIQLQYQVFGENPWKP